MTRAKRAQMALFEALLEYHNAQEEDGRVYKVDARLDELTLAKIQIHASDRRSEPVSIAVFIATLEELLEVCEKLTTEEIEALMPVMYPAAKKN